MRPEALVGATDWSTHPVDLAEHGVTRVRGTKNPDLAAIRALKPDIVIANTEENRELDVRRLRDAGIQVEVTDIQTVPMRSRPTDTSSTTSSPGPTRPGSATLSQSLWCGPLPPVTRRAAVAIWRDPWMVVASRTFTGDRVRRLGWQNVYAHHDDRYPHVKIADLDAARAEVVLLPDEAYVFTTDDGPEAFDTTPTELDNGRF